MSVYLVPLAKKGMRIPLDKAIVFIGRHPECDVVLTRSRKVSRKHCAIAQVNDSIVIRDLGSMNGVRVNGRVVRKETPLRVGDEVMIGDLSYILTVESATEAEKRVERERGVDAGASDGVSRRGNVPAALPEDLSREIPVAIPEPVEDFDDEAGGDTPKSMPLVGDDDEERDGDDSPLRLQIDQDEFRRKGSQIGMRPE